MPDIETLHSLEQIRLLSDPRRLAILRLLMDAPATLTQLGKVLGEHPAWVRHHLKQLEQVGLVEMVDTQLSGGFVEKFYQARARAFIFQQVILPQLAECELLVMLASHDLALELLAEQLKERRALELLLIAVGSLNGLVALRQGTAHLTGCHLLDAESGEHNLPYARHFFPDQDVLLVTVAERTQGLMVHSDNPRGIRGLADLLRPEVTLANRNRGSGTRLWLEHNLRLLGANSAQIIGFASEVHTHTEAARAVSSGEADVALGLEAAARQAELDFIPLFQERYDLVLPAEQAGQGLFQRLLDALNASTFRKLAGGLPGYSVAHTGETRLP